MAGSSGMVFARVADPARDSSAGASSPGGAVEHLRYRLRGSTDERTTEVLRGREASLIAGIPERGRRADGAGGAGRDPAADLPADARRGPRATRTRGAPPSSSAPPATTWSRRWPRCSAWTAGSAPATRSATTASSPASWTARSSTARARSRRCAGFADEHDIDLEASYAYSDSVSRPADAARRSATRSSSTPTRRCLEIARREGWQVMRFEKLGRKLAIAGATVLAAAGGAGALASKRRNSGRTLAGRRPLRR